MQVAAGGYYVVLLGSGYTAGGPALVEDLTYAQVVALKVTAPSCTGAMVLLWDPALVEDLIHAQVVL